MGRKPDEKAALVDDLRELHLPTMRSCFEELARQAEQETLSYERYLLTLAERECQDRRQRRIERLLRQLRLPLEKDLAGYEALILDDLGYVQQSREEMEVLFTLLAERYERGSVMITSNLPFSKWEGIFKDPMTTAAAPEPPDQTRAGETHNLTETHRISQRKKKNQKERNLLLLDWVEGRNNRRRGYRVIVA